MRGSRRWIGKRGRDGWAAFPGQSRYLSRCENVYSQRLPPGQGVANTDWQQAEASESEFLPGVAAIPSLGLPHPLPSTPSHLLDTLPHLSLSGMPAQGCQGQSGPVENERGCLPSFTEPFEVRLKNEHCSPHLEPALIT